MHTDPARTYRGRLNPRRDETAFQVVLEQTDLWVVAERDLSREILAYVEELRAGLKNHILLCPEFATSLTPLPVPESAPALVKAMARAAQRAGVGPMAAVAGAIAQAVAERFAPISPNIIVENGGDVFLRSTRDRVVALLSKPGEATRLGLAIPARRFPVAVCASSGKIGHSLSFGQADLVTVLGRTGALADAAATALANMVAREEDLEPMLKAARKLAPHGLLGVFARIDEAMAAWGDLELTVID